jgi:hypothetical protein
LGRLRRFEKVFVLARRMGKPANKKIGVYSQLLPSFTYLVIAKPITQLNL